MENSNIFLKQVLENKIINKQRDNFETLKQNIIEQRRELTFFGDNFFLSIDNNSLPQGSQGNFSIILNAIPSFNKLTSCWGYEKYGEHSDNDDIYNNSEQYKVIHISQVYTKQFDKTFPEIIKIVKNKSTKETFVYKINEDNIWEDISPLNDKGNKYNFIGEEFTTTNWKNNFYIVSGKEKFETKQTQKVKDKLGQIIGNQTVLLSGSILRYSLASNQSIAINNWSVIKTGTGGYLDNIFMNTSIYNANGDIVKDKLLLTSIGNDYNPSLIMSRGGRSYIAGALANDIQIKISEFDNLDNFVDNTLQGVNQAVLSSADSQRSSTFLASLQNDKITKLLDYNNKTLIGSETGWYQHDLTQGKTNAGAFTLYDQIQKIEQATIGPYNSRVVTPYAGGIMYLGMNNGVLSFCEIIANYTDSGTSYYSFTNHSNKIQKILNVIDIENTTLTIKEDYFIISSKQKCNNIPIQICGYKYRDKEGSNINFFLTDYLNIERAYTNVNGSYYGNSQDGNIYRITGNQDCISINNLKIDKPTAKIISLNTGYDKAKVSYNYYKTLNNQNISGVMHKDTDLELNIFDSDTNALLYDKKFDIPHENLMYYSDLLTGSTLNYLINDNSFGDSELTTLPINNYFEIDSKIQLNNPNLTRYRSCYYSLKIQNYKNYFEFNKISIVSEIQKNKI